MTRQKVPPEQRQRIAQACDSCKKRKQKCDGDKPCNTCRKRGFSCLYTTPSNHHATHAEKLARKKERHERALESAANQPIRPQVNPGAGPLPPFEAIHPPHNGPAPGNQRAPSFGSMPQPAPLGLDENMHKAARSLQQFSLPKARATNEDRTKSFLSIVTGLSGNEGETFMLTSMRMLQDPSGRVLFIGESATVAFLSLLRALVDPFVPSCDFVEDPRRHMITEPPFTLDPNTRIPPVLPDLKSAILLADSFFDNTCGLIYVFERSRFMSALNGTYDDPLSAEPEWLCQINLVFAIGLMLATPEPGTEKASLVEKLRDQHADRGEAFYLIAKGLSNPHTGFEDADFWSIQALLLMSVYMLTKSKRNTAFALLGMAVRSAYALGLHREDTLTVFPPAQQTSRRNLWKSLFVMDRFLALSLGRHPAILEDEAEIKSTPRTSISSEDINGNGIQSSFEQISADAIDAAIRASSFIGVVLKRIYQQRSIGISQSREMADTCKDWLKRVAPNLVFPSPMYPNGEQTIAVLHVHLLFYHSAILLCRPHFLYVLKEELERQRDPSKAQQPRRVSRIMEEFSRACVSAATHTINLVRPCWEAGKLSRRNPLVTYCVSSAGLVLLANEFAGLHSHPQADTCKESAFKIMQYCAAVDSQAERLHYIMETFQEAIHRRGVRTSRPNGHTNQLPPMTGGPTRTPGNMPLLPSPSSFRDATAGSEANYPPPFSAGSSSHHPNPFASPAPNYTNHSPIHPSGFHSSVMKSASSTPAPLDPPLNPSAPPNPLSPAPNRTALASNQIPYDPASSMNFTGLLDFASPFNTDMSSLEDAAGQDEHIDFDVFWTWNNPSAGGAVGMPASGAVQPLPNGPPPSMVPLYGVLDG